MLIAFSVAPSGTGRADGSVHDAVAAAVQVVRASGLPHRTTSMFTEVEGEWDEVMGVVKAATDAVLPYGSRVSLVLALLTQLVYPILYTGVISDLAALPIILLTARNALVVVLFAWMVVRVARVPARRRRMPASFA